MNKNFFKYSKYDDYDLPDFGFKIHISSTIHNYEQIKNLLIPFLDEKKISYKYINKTKDIYFNYSNKESPAESGKLFTIYPKDRDHFKDLIEEIYTYLPKDLDGIYVLSDRAYKDSKVIFYRYGTIKLNYDKTYKGIPSLPGPSGEIWQDYQKTYFDLPEWIEDIQEDEEYLDSYLSDNYQLESILKVSNGGNIYLATNADGDKVVIKESRPHILSYKKYSHRKELENEFSLNKKFDDHLAKEIERVEEWINRYYIYEYIEAPDLYNDLTSHGLFGYERENSDKNIALLKKYLERINKILMMVKYFHDRELVLNDIHPGNIKIKDDKAYFIDLGNSYIYGKNPRYGIYNDICLEEWNKIDGKLADIKKLGNLILYTIAKLHITDEDDLEDNINILDYLLKSYGIKTNLPKLIYKMIVRDFDINQLINGFKNIYIKEYDKKISLDLEKEVKNIKFEFDDYIVEYEFMDIVLEYDFNDKKRTKYMIDGEKKLGLFGISGILYYLSDTYHRHENLIEYSLESIISKLIEVKGNRMVPIRNYAASPYIDSGNSGFIKLLFKLDKDKYRDLIIELGENICFEFAQRPAYYDGMLGIADTLIDLYQFTQDEKYLKYIENLLLNSIFYLKYKKIRKDEFFYVYKRFQGLALASDSPWNVGAIRKKTSAVNNRVHSFSLRI